MDTSSSASPSSRSDGEHDTEEEEDSEDYGSCNDSDDADPWRRVLQQYQRGRSSGDQLKLKSLILRLSEENDPSLQLTGLMELCEVLSFCTEDSLSGVMADVLSRVLVKLAKDESNGDIMLLAIRVITCVMLTLVIQEMSKKFPSLMDTLVHEPDQESSMYLSVFNGLAKVLNEKFAASGVEQNVVVPTNINPKLVGGRLFLNCRFHVL